MKSSALGFALALVVCACTVGPSYRGPPSDIMGRSSAVGSFSGHAENGVLEAPLPEHWWKLYEDPRLDALVEQSLQANVDLRAAEANIKIATAVVQRAKAARTPTTTLEGGVGDSRLAIPTPSASQLGYSIIGSVAYPVDLFGGLKRGIEAAKYDAEAAMAARDEARVVVVAGVIRSYVDACSANHSYAAAAHVLDTQKETLATTDRLFKGGRATAFDVTRARVAVDQSAAQLPGFLAARQSALFQLGALLGGPPQEYPDDVALCEAPSPLRNPLPVGNGEELLRRRPDVRQAERTLAAATASIGVSVAKLYPNIVLGGSASSSGPFAFSATEESLAFSIGPLVTWSFPNQRIIRAEIAQAGATAEVAAAQFDSVVIGALRQTETALSLYARQIDVVSALNNARVDAEEAKDQAHRLYLFGRIDFINVLTADSALASADAALAQSQATLADDQIALFQTLGGGWQP